MLSYPELQTALEVIAPLVVGARVQRVVQPDDHTLVLELYGWDSDRSEGGKRVLKLSCHPQFGRVALCETMPKAPAWPPEFAAFLKSRMSRPRLKQLELLNQDRQLVLHLEDKQGGLLLLLSLMGNRSNIYALAPDMTLSAAMRPLAVTRAELRLGERWVNPEKKTDLNAGSNRFGAAPQFLAEMERWFAAEEAAFACEQRRHALGTAIRRELDFATRKEANLRQDLEDAKRAREKKRLGELLKSVMGDLPPGAEKAVARDFESGEAVEIPLDPALSPAQNLEKLFKQYHKGLVGTNMLGQQLDITHSHVNDLQELQAALAEAGTPDDVRAFAERPDVQALLRKHTPEAKPARPPKKRPTRKEVPARLLPRRYRTSDGLEVWVGRSDEGNDYLTTRLANGTDLFFHVEGYPGSHTILRLDGKKDAPQESVLEAAELAVQFSKMKDAGKITVHIAPVKHVHKPKGAKPGLVYVNQGRSIVLRRDQARLQRILDARIAETGRRDT
ncbi:MAG: DUF814 domain-containing protein [Planctomycetes bacterium]|nr:DUF814 domain-containing protein [Planctomycetota bacterium]